MKKSFEAWNPSKKSQALLDQINEVLEDLHNDGFILSLRQLHYQLVSRNITPNTQQSYDNLGSLLTKARMAGLVDWDYIEDRHRNPVFTSTWSTPNDILRSAAHSFALNHWSGQPEYIEIWVEKDALSGVLEPLCRQQQVGFMACKGYLSVSAKYLAMQRFSQQMDMGKTPTIIYLGDHDPSGLDMPRNIEADMELMLGEHIEVERIGLTMQQIREYNLPPNFAKETDVRMPAYRELHGDYSWELDALPPSDLQEMVELAILSHRDDGLYDMVLEQEKQQRQQLFELARNWKG